MNQPDPYREWDAAYVLGALSPEDRRAYEGHLASCDACSAAVAELAAMPGLLMAVDPDTIAFEESWTRQRTAVPDTLLPRLVNGARRHRRRARALTAAGFVGVAAAAAAIALLLPGTVDISQPTPQPVAESSPSKPTGMDQVVPSALTADFLLDDEVWGTRVETHCRYAPVKGPGTGYDGEAPQAYGLYVTDRAGLPTVVATWRATPGSSVAAVGTTRLDRRDIASIDIRSLATGQVLLASAPAA